VRESDLADAILWIRRGGFPGELTDADVRRAREVLAQNPGVRGVVVALGGGSFQWVDAASDEPVSLLPDAPRGLGPSGGGSGGYRMGTGDGATLPGVPLSWRLLRFVCPQQDTTVLVARYPAAPLTCPTHGIPLERAEEPA
jgi:hypothetical protein